jgi:hypothetical protein
MLILKVIKVRFLSCPKNKPDYARFKTARQRYVGVPYQVLFQLVHAFNLFFYTTYLEITILIKTLIVQLLPYILVYKMTFKCKKKVLQN